jgi:5'-nucleotidase
MNIQTILVTNDDGITAKGIQSLKRIAINYGNVTVVAPDKPQSGMGHAITLGNTLRALKVPSDLNINEYACSGTPVDCVKLAVAHLLPSKPTLVLSGINHGSNSAISVIYSGTMSAAVEGAIEGVASIGFSLCSHDVDADFMQYEPYIRKVIDHVITTGLDAGICLNVNIPDVPVAQIKGIKVCRQAKAVWVEKFDQRTDPMGNPYYWLTGYLHNEDLANDTDEYALAHNYISVVPVQYDLTAHNAIHKHNGLELA